MAFSWNIDTSESIEYDDALEYFARQGKNLFEANLDEAAWTLRKLANNRRFLTERLNGALKDLKTFQSGNPYTSQVFLLHASEAFYVRANVWEPSSKKPGESLFFYESAHDHNFHFLTVGYHGSGYRTQIYEYEQANVIGYAGEPVELRFLEETTLPLGKVMFFRRSVDIHTQLPPADLSISINILKRLGDAPLDQYFFDTNRRQLASKADKLTNGVVLRLAGAVGDDNTIDVLSHIARSHKCRRTRLLAYEMIARRGEPRVWTEALADADQLVRKVADQNLTRSKRAG